MSTIINNSYKIYAKNLDEVIQILKFKPKSNNIDDFLKNLKQERTTQILSKLYDLTVLKNTVISDLSNTQIIDNEDHIFNLKSYFVQNEQKTEDTYNSFYLDTENYISEISIFPTQLNDHQGTYYLFSCLSNYYTEEATNFHVTQLMKDYPISSYDFQNSTDKPDNINEKEWEKRESDWDITLPSGNLRQAGIVLHIAELPIRNYKIDTLSENFLNKNPISLRMEKIINDYIANNIFTELLTKEKEKTSNINAELPISTFVRVMCNVNENKIDEKWKNFKDQLINHVKKYIPEINTLTLTTPLQNIIEQINTYQELVKVHQITNHKTSKPKI